ncbi:hypothetical protein JXA48_02600 [Candidatus Woesearchaeota archaeon]|nr:hypothetical protein [Candidatus Woesearchaeota archaeon]
MQFKTERAISKDYIPNKILTYIASDEGRLLEIKAIGETEIGLNLKTMWYIPYNISTIVNCYNTIISEIDTFSNINYEVAIGSQGKRKNKREERKIPFSRLDKVIHPLILARPKDIALGINSNYGSFWLEGDNIQEGADFIEIVSPFNLAKLISQLLRKTNIITTSQRQDMETILDLSYDYYLNEDRNKMFLMK